MASSAVVGYLRAILTMDTAEFEAGVGRAARQASTWSKDVKKMGEQASAIGGSMTRLLTLPIVGVGAAAVAAGAKFEQTMNQIGAVTNASAEDMKRLSDAALEWGSKTKFSNTEAAQAMLELGKAGFSTDQTIAALPSTLQLATAANMALGEAATLTANVMKTFGHGVQDLAHDNDILTEAANRSTIDVADLRESLKFVGPVARAAGISLADVAAASASLGEAGIKAEMAGTGLRGMLTKILAPTKETVGAFLALGYSQTEIATGQIQWADLLDRLHVKLQEGGVVADQYTGVIMKGFGQRAGPAVLAMAQTGGEAIKQLSAELDASTGSAERMTDAFMKGLPGAMEQAKGSMETMLASIETALAPTLEIVFKLISQIATFVSTYVVPAFNALPEPVKMAGIAFVGLVAAAGPVIFVIGQVLSAAGSIAAAFGTAGVATTALTAVMPYLGAAFAVLTGPIGLVVGAIVGLGIAWYTWGDDVTAVVKSTYAAVKEWLWDKFEPVLAPIMGLIHDVGEMFEAFAKLVGAVVKKVYDVTKEYILDKLTPIWEGLVATVKTVYTGVKGWLDKIPDSLLPLLGPIGAVVLAFRRWDEIKAIAQAVYTAVKTWLVDKFVDIVNGVRDKVQAVTGFFKDMYDKVVGHSFVPDMIEGIKREFGRLGDVMEKPAAEATGQVSELFDSMSGGVVGTVKSMFQEIAVVIQSWGSTVSGIIQTHIGGPIGGAIAGIAGNLFGGLAGIVTGGISTLIGLAAPLLLRGLQELGELAWRGLKSLGGAIWDGMKALGGGIKDFFSPRSSPEAQQEQQQQQFLDDAAYMGMTPDEWAAYSGQQSPIAMDVPELASGGIVMPRPGGTIVRLAEAGIPEAVVPMDGRVGGGTMQIIVQQDGRTTAEWLIPFMPGAVRRLGLAGTF